MLAATGCGSLVSSQARPGQRPRTGGPAPGASGAPTNLDPALGLLLGAPVYDGDFADPYVLVDNGRYFAYATNTKGANIPVLMTSGGGSGQYFGDAFPSLPSWSTPGFVWAPAVYAVAGQYVLYYTTHVNATGRQCLSRAVAPTPVGPFSDTSSQPLVCQADLGGTIDPSLVADPGGQAWLLFKNDGNCCGITTSLWSQELSPDGLSVVGTPAKLLSADQPWEGGLIEAPSMVTNNGTYYLFYSANAWDSENYAIGYATCTSISGPCTKPADSPWMTSTALAKGPGGQEFYAAVGQLFIVYHGWTPGEIGYSNGGERRLYLDSIRIVDGRPIRVGSEQVTFAIVLAVATASLALGIVVAFIALVIRHRRRRRRLHSATSHHASP